MDDLFWAIMVIVLVGTVVLILCREVTCWYFKINDMLKTQKEIAEVLNKIARLNNPQDKTPEETPEINTQNFTR